jgi:transposase
MAANSRSSRCSRIPDSEKTIQILEAIDKGQEQAAEQLLPVVYDELRRLAARKLAHEPHKSLQATGLVHEAFLRLVGSHNPGWKGKTHFFGAAAEAMRRVLIDRARAAKRQKRGGGKEHAQLRESLVRIKHVQHKYACRQCEQNGHNPNITLADKTNGSPIDKGMPGPGLLAHVATSKFSDYLPLHRLENIFAREGFDLDRSTMCVWMADAARLVRPLYDRMAHRVRKSHVLATDDTAMPMQQPGKTKKARMWIYQGDESHPYNVFEFTVSRTRDGPATFLKDFRNTLLADAYGGYDGIVLNQELPRAGCWAHARRKFIDCQAAAPQATHAILGTIKRFFALEERVKDLDADERLRRRQAEAAPLLDSLHTLLTEQKAKLLPKHPLAQAMAYTLNHWSELTLFVTDPAIPIHNNLAEQQMKRIALLRKNALFVATPGGGETAAILSTLTSTCRRHDINPQTYLTQLLANLPDTPMSRIEEWLPDEWKRRQASPAAQSSSAQT